MSQINHQGQSIEDAGLTYSNLLRDFSSVVKRYLRGWDNNKIAKIGAHVRSDKKEAKVFSEWAWPLALTMH